MSDNKEPEKSKREKIAFYVPDYVYWKIKRRIGEGNVNALMKIFAHQFANGKAGVNIDFEPSESDLKKVA